ncbi:MAG TPA: tetratricopeptide repeat protein [Rhizomicrobium sp.]|jgi:Flp pilus assembly protein TadD
MKRATLLSAALVLCAFSEGGCESIKSFTGKSQANATPAATSDASLSSDSDLATLNKTLPQTLDGEIRRAQLLRAKGDYDDAVKALAQLMLIAPDDPRVVGEYGKVLVQQGHSKDALPFLKRAVELQPRDASVQSALGIAYDQLDDHASARAAYEHALALKPDDASILNNFAVSRTLAGDIAGADTLFARAAAHGSSNPKIANNAAELERLKPPALVKPAAPKAEIVAAVATPVPQLPKGHVVAHPAPPPVRVAAVVPKSVPLSKTKSTVVMERIPVDPLAGPVASTAHKLASEKQGKLASAAHKLASARRKALKHLAQKPMQPPPALRTASDTN